jgi:hypothetical protein
MFASNKESVTREKHSNNAAGLYSRPICFTARILQRHFINDIYLW